MKELIKKYDRQGPRYTSYPPVPFWKGRPTAEEWQSELAGHTTLDLYLHIPFCEKLCYYCGCHRVVTKDKSRGEEYADLLLREWSLYQKLLPQGFSIGSLHFGGGTPTFLSAAALRKILTVLCQNLSPDFIGAIEIDPRTFQYDQLQVLKEFGITRTSLGIQDFDPVVQKKINREQSFELVRGVVDKLRENGMPSINFDLIYGLPGQTQETITQTIQRVRELAPDTIAFYSYAHLPERIANQRLIKTNDLPSPEEKLELYLTGQRLLLEAGYVDIGMDHFAKESSHLAKKDLTRNFMGYTDKKSPLLIGLGVSAIGQSPSMFVQNAKELGSYQEAIERGELPIAHGHVLAPLEKEVSQRIQDIFCRGTVRFSIAPAKTAFEELEADGLISWKSPQELEVTHLGKKFLRNIAMVLDPLMQQETTARFSKTI